MKDKKAVVVVLVVVIVVALAFVVFKATSGSGPDGGDDYDDSPMDPSQIGVPPEEPPSKADGPTTAQPTEG